MNAGIDQSHVWQGFDDSEPAENLFCARCEVCTCHSPKIAARPCEYADVHHGGAA